MKILCPWVRRKARNVKFNTGQEPCIKAMAANAHGVFFGSIGVMPWSYDWSKGTGNASVCCTTALTGSDGK